MRRAARGVGLLASAGLWLAAAGGSSAQGEEASRFCDPNGANLILFLDVTTPYDEIDKTALIDGIGRILAHLTGGERITIRTIEDAFSRSRRLLDTCFPYCPPGGIFDDLFSTCTEGVVINEKKRMMRTFVVTLTGLLDSARELDQSEIIRTLTLSLREEYRRDRPNRVFVYSDMIENSTYLSGMDFFRAKDGPLIEQLERDGLVPSIWEAEVHIFGIGRTGITGDRSALPQERLNRLTSFWTKYFAAGGATVRLTQNLSLDD
jgi:hypothetical protein